MTVSDILLFCLSFLGSFVGVNFGGAMLFVMPVLLGFGYSPLVALGSTRPAMLIQGVLGHISFKEFNKSTATQQIALLLSAILGSIIGFYFLSTLNERMGEIVVILIILFLAMLAALRYLFWPFFRKKFKEILHSTYKPHFFSQTKSVFLYSICGFFPSVLSGLVGGGAGLITLTLCIILLRKNLKEGAFLEKIVGIGSSLTILIVAMNYGYLNPKIIIITSVATSIGAYLGAKLTIHAKPYWLYFVIVLLCLFILVKKII